MTSVGRRQFVVAKMDAWKRAFQASGLRGSATCSDELAPETRINIGRNTERLVLETERFLERGYSTRLQSLLHPQVTLLIQNGPDDVLLRVHGENMYHRVYQVLRWTMAFWYGLRYDQLRVHVAASSPGEEGASPLRLRLRWRVEGRKRRLLWIRPLAGCNDSLAAPIISGYSYYQFDQSTGVVRQHTVDRLVPPAARGSLLWRYLERLQVAPLPAKPLVGSSGQVGTK